MNVPRLLSVSGAVLALASLGAFAGTPVPAGKSSFVFIDAKGHAERPVPVYTYRPATCDAKCPMVFSIHGVSRGE